MSQSASQYIASPVEDCRTSCSSLTREMHQMAESLGNAIDAKDHFTRQHSDEVAVVAHLLALRLGLPPQQADLIHIAGHLHDIGKIGVPDRILLKPGPLDEAEWAEVKRHPDIGAEIIAPVDFLSSTGIVAMVRHHHEAYDGSGYPQGLSGQDIPLGARVIAVADSLSAMLQERPYRPKLGFSQALAEIIPLSGVRYDPQVVAALLAGAGAVASLMTSLRLARTPCAVQPPPYGEPAGGARRHPAPCLERRPAPPGARKTT